jgi:RNA polymerase sigma-70 factor (ECF subfamily)
MDKSKVLSSWVSLYTHDLLNWALQRVSVIAVAEDLVQDTFLSAYGAYQTFENRSSPKSWLIAILNRKIIDHYRKEAKMKFVNVEGSEENISILMTNTLFQQNESWVNNESGKNWDSDEHLLDNEDFNKVMAACMDDLPAKWKYIVSSKYIDDKNTSSICQEMEITQSNYWQIVHRAKLLLKVCIEKYWK